MYSLSALSAELIGTFFFVASVAVFARGAIDAYQLATYVLIQIVGALLAVAWFAVMAKKTKA